MPSVILDTCIYASLLRIITESLFYLMTLLVKPVATNSSVFKCERALLYHIMHKDYCHQLV